MTARLPRIAALHLPDEDDYGLALYDERRGVWVLVEGRAVGDIGAGRVDDLIPGRWERRLPAVRVEPESTEACGRGICALNDGHPGACSA